jgi:hypothetical protein
MTYRLSTSRLRSSLLGTVLAFAFLTITAMVASDVAPVV